MISHLRDFITKKKFDELFSQGACFHFAVRSYVQGIGEFYCTKSGYEEGKIDHVFVILSDGRVFDRRGYRSLDELILERRATNGHRPATKEEIETRITTMGVPDDLHHEIYAIADELIGKLR